MKKRGLLVCGVVLFLTAAYTQVMFADNQKSMDSTEQTSQTSSSSIQSSDKPVDTSTGNFSKELTITEEKQQIKQTIHIQKVVKEGNKRANLEGINGAHFVVYDLTNLLNEVIREGKTDKQSVEQIEQLVKERANKLAPDQLKKVTEGETQTVDQKRGVFSFSTRLMENHKKAYYLVNTSSPTHISNSESIVFFTPVCDEDGNRQSDVWLYPKSQKKRPKIEVKRIVSTGIKRDWWSGITDIVKGWFE